MYLAIFIFVYLVIGIIFTKIILHLHFINKSDDEIFFVPVIIWPIGILLLIIFYFIKLINMLVLYDPFKKKEITAKKNSI